MHKYWHLNVCLFTYFSLVTSSHVTFWSSFPIRERQVFRLTINLSHPIIPVGLISSHLCEVFTPVMRCFSFPPTCSTLFPRPWLPITPENLSPFFPSVKMSLLFRFQFVILNAFHLPLSILPYPYPVQKVCGSHGYTTLLQISGRNQIRRVTTFIDRKTRGSKGKKWNFQVKRQQRPRASRRTGKLSSEAPLVSGPQKVEETLRRQRMHAAYEGNTRFSSGHFYHDSAL